MEEQIIYTVVIETGMYDGARDFVSIVLSSKEEADSLVEKLNKLFIDNDAYLNYQSKPYESRSEYLKIQTIDQEYKFGLDSLYGSKAKVEEHKVYKKSEIVYMILTNDRY
jgi:hypothetical protein